MASIPYDRVRFLLGRIPKDAPARHGWQQKATTQSPTTLTARGSGLYSYEMEVAWFDGEDFIVTREYPISPTTNRHVSAIHMCFTNPAFVGDPDLKFEAIEETITVNRRRQWSFFEPHTYPVTRYRRIQ